MDPEKAAYAVIGSIGGAVIGLLSGLLKGIFPTYKDLADRNAALVKENDELREEVASLLERIRGLQDTLTDGFESDHR